MIEQGTPEWFAQRLGKVTASRVADIIAKTKTGVAASRGNYMAQLVAERLTGQPAESFKSAAMQFGTETEPMARMAYETQIGMLVDEVAMIPHPTIEMSGASPDGLVGHDGLVDIKCPNTSSHIETLLDEKVPSKYVTQMMWQMACTVRSWCDFVSFDIRLPEHKQLFIVRFEPKQAEIDEMLEKVVVFLQQVEKECL